MRTYEKTLFNPFRMRTYKNTRGYPATRRRAQNRPNCYPYYR
jgi:hypothetical protein